VETEVLARRWRDAWAEAWPRRDVDAIAVLYRSGAAYRSHPLRAAGTPRAYLERVFAEEEAIECWFGEPLVAGDRAAVEWWASYREAGEDVTLAGTTVLRFDGDGLVSEHVDYWVEGPGRTAPFPGWGGLAT
jgi:SnoaL-like domain